MLAVLAVYYLAPRRLQWVVLLAASYGFYLTGGLWAIDYLLFTTLTTWLAGRALGRSTTDARLCPRRTRPGRNGSNGGKKP